MDTLMDYTNEYYTRDYVRDTEEWLDLSWRAQGLFRLLVRKMNRAGILEAKRGAKSICTLLRVPVQDQGEVEQLLAELLRSPFLRQHKRGYIFPDYIAANEAIKSDAQRKRDSREGERAKAMFEADQLELEAEVQVDRAAGQSVHPATATGHPVTKRDSGSRNVTECPPESTDRTKGHSDLTGSGSDLVLTSPEDPDARVGAHAREARTGPESRPDVPCGTGEEAEPEDPIDFQRELLRRAAVDEMTEEQWAEWDRKVIANRSAHPIPHTGTRRANA